MLHVSDSNTNCFDFLTARIFFRNIFAADINFNDVIINILGIDGSLLTAVTTAAKKSMPVVTFRHDGFQKQRPSRRQSRRPVMTGRHDGPS